MVVWVFAAWGIVKDANICIDHIVITNHEKSWSVDWLFFACSLHRCGLSNAGESLVHLVNEAIVVDSTCSNNDNVISEVVSCAIVI